MEIRKKRWPENKWNYCRVASIWFNGFSTARTGSPNGTTVYKLDSEYGTVDRSGSTNSFRYTLHS